MGGFRRIVPLKRLYERTSCPDCGYIGQRVEFHKGKEATAMIGTCPKCNSEVMI